MFKESLDVDSFWCAGTNQDLKNCLDRRRGSVEKLCCDLAHDEVVGLTNKYKCLFTPGNRFVFVQKVSDKLSGFN